MDIKSYKSPGQYLLEQYEQRLDDPDFNLWLNLGFWRQAVTYDSACAAMARMVAEKASIGPGDIVLDAGCGFGEPALYWYREYKPEMIVALNIDWTQLQVAARRRRTLEARKCLNFFMATATRVPFRNNSFTKVIALESAFYFDTREDFLHEAYRVLRPGGKLVIADLLPTDNWEQTEWNRRVRWYSMKPEANVYSLPTYVERICAAGFNSVRGESIRESVFPGMAKVVQAIRDQKQFVSEIVVQLAPRELEECIGVELWEGDLGLGDFAIFEGVKPT